MNNISKTTNINIVLIYIVLIRTVFFLVLLLPIFVLRYHILNDKSILDLEKVIDIRNNLYYNFKRIDEEKEK